MQRLPKKSLTLNKENDMSKIAILAIGLVVLALLTIWSVVTPNHLYVG
jgi:hypothetical protein